MDDLIMTMCTLEQMEELIQVGTQTFIETYGEFNTTENMTQYIGEHYCKETLRKEITNPMTPYYLLKNDDVVAGFIKMNFGKYCTEPDKDSLGEIERIYLKREFQGHGLGKKMFNFALEKAKEKGSQGIFLGVWEHNQKAMAFYQKRGMTFFGTHSFWLGQDEQKDYLLELTW